MVKSAGMSNRAMRSSTFASRAPTISAVTRDFPASSFGRLDSSVATSAMRTHRSRSSRVNRRSSSESGTASARAIPIMAWASSTAPLISMTAESFRTRPPKRSPVVPSSPVFV